MKKILIAFAFIAAPLIAGAQLKTPQASPKATVFQTVGLTDVEIVYCRPAARGRAVFGNLVPFGKVWRTGANENTTISFSEDVVIDGKTLPKGKYALYTIPKIESWEVIFYSTTNNWGNPEVWNEANVVLRTTVKEEALSKPVESFTIGIGNITADAADLDMAWENSSVSMKFIVPTQKEVLANIEKVLAGPTSADYFSAAQYLYQSNGDNAKASAYMDKAMEMSTEKPYWYTRLKSLIQARAGDKKGAIETANLSLTAAETAKNQDYVKMNRESIAEWSKK
ncbi:MULTISPECIES: DUF2911 domain-containing protein [Flavobacterium]|uniref:DUF2911 domain-containing protein n=1 Tax=Flavobacterium TaxID=237 RepID=UPI00188D7472|nr:MULTISPECIES: DUF2911 domain-containing protein [Flavobacterium]MBF4472581.1 DUF2911 domain-containing protein [Flavobacterium sp. HJJ]